MSLSASSLGCARGYLGLSSNVRRGNVRSIVRTGGCRCEVKSDESGGKQCVQMEKSGRKESGWPAEAAKRAVNDAMLMCAAAQTIDERARNDLILLSRSVCSSSFSILNGSSLSSVLQ